jgi:hypothetical protein
MEKAQSFTWVGTPNQQALGALFSSIAWYVAQVEAERVSDEQREINISVTEPAEAG